VEVALEPSSPLRQAFVVPTQGVRAIEAPLAPGGGPVATASLRMELWSGGRRLHRRLVSAGGRADDGLVLRLPWHRRLRAGQTLRLDLLLQPGRNPPGDAPRLLLSGLRRPVFPLLAAAEGAEGALALRFVHRQSAWERARFVTLRAWELLRTGQGRLLLRAAARRLPPAARPLARLLGRF
jgi:hypothetical protein